MKVLIVANGEPPSERLMAMLAPEVEKIFVVDGAANSFNQKFKPDVICGDFDSIDEFLVRERFSGAEFIKLNNQDLNDLEKTIALVCERGATDIYILGAFGNRIDQQLVTISLGFKLHKEIAITIYSEHEKIIMLSPGCARAGKHTAVLSRDQIVSLIAFSADAMVSLSGVKWPLNNHALALGSSGVSNCALGGEIALVVHEGIIVCALPLLID